MESYPPEPEPRGFLDPPRRDPPTAVGTATPEPSPEPPRREGSSRAGVLRSVLRAVNLVRRSLRHVLR